MSNDPLAATSRVPVLHRVWHGITFCVQRQLLTHLQLQNIHKIFICLFLLSNTVSILLPISVSYITDNAPGKKKNGSIFLSVAPRFSKVHFLLEGSRASPVCLSGKSNMYLKMSMEIITLTPAKYSCHAGLPKRIPLRERSNCGYRGNLPTKEGRNESDIYEGVH